MTDWRDYTPNDARAHNARIARGRGLTSEGDQEIARDARACEDETELHYQIIDECNRRGWLYFHGSMAHRTRRTKGEPDFHIYATGGRAILVECKDKDGKLTKEQNNVLHHARRNGHTAIVVTSFEQFLELVGK